MLKISWIWKTEIGCEELVDGYQTVSFQPGTLIWSGQLSDSVSNQDALRPTCFPDFKITKIVN